MIAFFLFSFLFVLGDAGPGSTVGDCGQLSTTECGDENEPNFGMDLEVLVPLLSGIEAFSPGKTTTLLGSYQAAREGCCQQLRLDMGRGPTPRVCSGREREGPVSGFSAARVKTPV